MAETIEIRTGDKRKTNIALTRDGLFIQASFIDDVEAPGPTEIWCGEFAAPEARALAASLTQMADRIEGKEPSPLTEAVTRKQLGKAVSEFLGWGETTYHVVRQPPSTGQHHD